MNATVLACPGNEQFAGRIAEELGVSQLAVEFRQFPDGESYVRLLDDCAGVDVFVVCTLCDPDDKFVRLAYTSTLLRERGAGRVVLVAPYLGYMRQDRAFHDGEAVTAPMFAKLLSPLFAGLVTVDPHLHRIEHLEDVYEMPCVNVHAAPAIASWIADRVDRPLFVGPDVESKQWVSAVAAEIGAPYVALDKIRRGDRDVEVSVPQLEKYPDRTPVIVDDIISTARTMIETVHHLHDLGAPPPVCVGVHAVFAGDAFAALRGAGAAQVATTTTIAHEASVIDVAGMVSDGCRAILERT